MDDDSSDSSDDGMPTQQVPKKKIIRKKEQNRLLSTSSNIYSESKTFQRTIGNGAAMTIQPEKLEFRSMRPGVLYVMTFSIRNITQVAQRVRIQAPKTGFFALNFIPSGVVAPGIDIRAEIECQLPEGATDMVYYDSVFVTMGPHTVEVPLIALKPYAIVKFEPVVNMGYISEGSASKMDVSFVNEGDIVGSVKLQPQGDDKKALKITPSAFALAPSERLNATIFFEGTELGAFREIIDVIMPDCLEHGILDVNAHVLPQRLSIVGAENGGALSDIDFGSLFYGESRSMNALIVNSGPQQLSFSINYGDEEDPLSVFPQSDEDSKSAEKAMTIAPADGVVRPFSQLPVVIQFSPEFPLPRKGFKKPFHSEVKEVKIVNRKVFVDSLEIGLRIPLSLNAKVSPPVMTVTPNMLRFGICPVNDRRDILLEVVNHSALPAEFVFPQLAHFRVKPASGILEANQTRSIIATFHPSQLGEFKAHIQMTVQKGLQVIDLKAFGECDNVGMKKTLTGGIDKLPENFEIQYKFADPLVVAMDRKAKLEKVQEKVKFTTTLYGCLPAGDTEIDENFELKSIGEKTHDRLYDPDDITLDGHKEIKTDFELRQDNNATYNDFLKRSRILRDEHRRQVKEKRLTARGANERSNPFGVDMGMERGLEEPKVLLPVANEKLWLESDARNEGPGRGKKPFDENRLIQKKYPEQPTTQAELRDCSTELDSEELKKITASHKILNFGRVCIGSVSVKNFVVFNDLEHCVQARILDLQPELKQSRPDTQVLPTRSMGGFDITFSCKVLGEYKKSFSWTINGVHTFKVLVVAEVVPVELVLSKKNLILDFPDNSLEPTAKQDLTLFNPGNANAEFLWGSAGAFECKPEKGFIKPGQTSVISVLWTPALGKRNDEELGLHIPSGIDQTVSVAGNYFEADCEFEEKTVNLGLIAVGIEKVATATIKNTSEVPAVFYISPIEDKYGIQVVPNMGMIMPGDSFPLKVTAQPGDPLNFSRVSLVASIRGGKQISVKMEGQAIVPTLKLEQPVFAFGVVGVGAEWRLPFTVANESTITACMILDLNQYQDFKPCINATGDDAATIITNAQDDANGNQISLMPIDRAARVKKSNKWRLTLIPGGTITGSLCFLPQALKTYAFPLPLFLEGVRADTSFQREVTAEAHPAQLLASSTVIDFGDRVVARDPMARVTYFLEFTLSNVDSSRGFAYEIKEQEDPDKAVELASPPHTAPKSAAAKKAAAAAAAAAELEPPTPPTFFISPMRGDLAAGSSCPIRVTFQPHDSADYSKRLDVFITGWTRPYMTLSCKGTGAFPRLSFDKQQLSMPTVPLNVTSRASFYVINNGYTNLNLKYRVSPTVPIPLDISFPDGEELGLSVERVRVIVAAKSDNAVSWNGKIEFYDPAGDRFQMNVSGCADGSLFTNYPFVKAYHQTYAFVGLDNQPAKYLPKEYVAALRDQDTKRREYLRKQRQLERLQIEQELEASAAAGKSGKPKKTGSVVESSAKSVGGASATSGGSSSKKGKKDGVSFDLNYDLDSHEGVDIDTPEYDHMQQLRYISDETRAVLKWLNKFVCRKPFDEERYPECITESYGDIAIDCIEQMMGRKIQGIKPGAAEGCDGQMPASNFGARRTESAGGPPAGGAAVAGSLASLGTSASKGRMNARAAAKIAMSVRLVGKFRAVLLTLSRNGCLLNHIDPVSLLGHDEYMSAQETELRRIEGNRFTPSILKERMVDWEKSWRGDCQVAWMEVLFQTIKVYLVSRATYKAYTNLPGTVLVMRQEDEAGKDDKSPKKGGAAAAAKADAAAAVKKRKGPSIPGELLASNVYSCPEAILLSWASYHLQKASNTRDEGAGDASSSLIGLNRRVVDLETDFSDLFAYCQLFHSHVPELTKQGNPLSGYTTIDLSKREETYTRLVKAFEKARLFFDPTELELVSSARFIMLMILHLFLGLPSLVPKSTIEFKGMLGEPIVKFIELQNPTKKRVVYDITIEGSSTFSTETNHIVLPPESAVEVPVTFQAQFSDPVSAVISFWGVREGGAAGTTMVFRANGIIAGRIPREVIRRSIGLFEFDRFSIPIKNTFLAKGHFPVVVNVVYDPVSVEEMIVGESKRKKQKPPVSLASMFGAFDGDGPPPPPDKSEEDLEAEKLYKVPYWFVEESVELESQQSRSMVLHMLPFMMGTYTCTVVLVDPKVGEFSYEVVTEVGLPKAIEHVDFTALEMKDGGSTKKALRLGSKNPAFEKALVIATDIRTTNPTKKAKARSTLQNLVAAPLKADDSGTSRYTIEIQSPFFTYGKEVLIVPEYPAGSPIPPGTAGGGTAAPHGKGGAGKPKKVGKTGIDDISATDPSAANTAVISFRPEKAGSYHAKAIVYCTENKYDVRVLDIAVGVGMPPSQQIIEFRGPARQKMSQELPIRNDSDKTWTLMVLLKGPEFTAPHNIVVPPGESVDLLIGFFAVKAGTYDGQVALRNSEVAGDSFIYHLKASVDEPLAETHLSFKCKARSKYTFSIKVEPLPIPPEPPVEKEPRSPNRKTDTKGSAGKLGGGGGGGGGKSVASGGSAADHADSPPKEEYQHFSVETDLPYITGSPTVTVKVDGAGKNYDFTILSPVSGFISGSMTFINQETGAISWYTVDIDVTSPEAESTIEVASMVRKAAAVEITLENPTKETLRFSVNFDGDGLLGDAYYDLPPNGAAVGLTAYELIYSPLLAGDFIGKISFVNEKIGEFWYKLLLTAIPAPPMQIDLIECMVGLTETVQVPIENPLTEQVSLTVSISDPDHFSISPDIVKLGPYAQTFFDVIFKPSSLSDIVEGEISLSHPNFGEMKYLVRGKGLLPGIMPSTELFSPLGDTGSHTIPFRNPFPFPLPVDFILSDSAPAFSLVLRKATDVVIPARSTFPIGVGFSPRRLGEYKNNIQARSSIGGLNLLWCFPLTGMAESAAPIKLARIATQCKASTLRDVDVPLVGLMRADLAPGDKILSSDFSVEINVPDARLRTLVLRAFRAQPLELVERLTPPPAEGDTSAVDYIMRYRLLFEPLRSFTTTIEIIIVCRNRGRWRLQLDLDAADPEPDDTIRLTAAVGQRDQVTFRLSNRFLGFSTFEAYFNARSSAHFSVSPATGVLAPFGSDGTPFVVSFAPPEYGSVELGTLVIATEDAQWNYRVEGSYPKLVGKAGGGSVRSKLSLVR